MWVIVSERHAWFIWLLGGLGLVPFVVGLGLAVAGITVLGLSPKLVFLAYSATIISFLSGTVWASALKMKPEKFAFSLMLLSNLFVLVAWACLLLGSIDLAIAVIMLLYPTLLMTEKSYREELHRDYIRMRTTLTCLVFATHALMLLWG